MLQTEDDLSVNKMNAYDSQSEFKQKYDLKMKQDHRINLQKYKSSPYQSNQMSLDSQKIALTQFPDLIQADKK